MKEVDQDRAFDMMEMALVALLARGETVENAAQIAGVSERTVYRRKENPEFRAKVAECRANMFSSAAGHLLEVMQIASETLQSLMQNEDANIQYKAAVKLIELAFKIRQIDEQDRERGKLKVIVSTTDELPQQTGNVLQEGSPLQVSESERSSTSSPQRSDGL